MRCQRHHAGEEMSAIDDYFDASATAMLEEYI